VENVNDDLSLLVDGVQFDAAIVTVSEQILLVLLVILGSIRNISLLLLDARAAR